RGRDAGLTASGADDRRAGRRQPAADLVLAGGALLLAARAAVGDRVAAVRPHAAAPRAPRARGVDGGVGARAGHALLRRLPDPAAGHLADRALAAAARAGPRCGCALGRGRAA